MKIRTIIFSLLGMGLIGGAIGAYLYMKPVTSIEDMDVDMAVSAEMLFDQYQISEEDANAEFLGKVLEVEGIVREVRESDESEPILVLETSDIIFGVICEFEKGPVSADVPEVGDKVNIKGICNGMLMDVVLNKCMIAKQ